MSSLPLTLAGIASLVAFLAHVFIGTKKNASPILNNEAIPNDPRWTMIFSWQSNSVLLLFLAVGFIWAATTKGKGEIAYFTTGLATVLAIHATIIAIISTIQIHRFPPAMLFILIAIFGIWAVLTGARA